MSALVKTSSFALLKPSASDWGGEADDYTQQGAPVGGTLSGQQGVSDGQGNVLYQHKLTLDPCVLEESWRVKDLSTSVVYSVVSVSKRTTLIPCVVAQVSVAISSP